MTLFIDTSAFYALLDADDAKHEQAAKAWSKWLREGEDFATSNYVMVEIWSLLQSRLGIDAVRVFQQDLLPVVHIEWLDRAMHEVAARVVVASERQAVSLVDRTSFEVMRERGIESAFTFDRHFRDEGFTVAP